MLQRCEIATLLNCCQIPHFGLHTGQRLHLDKRASQYVNKNKTKHSFLKHPQQNINADDLFHKELT